MLKRISLFSVLLITACSYGTGNETANLVANEMTYSKDARTNLCFGSVSSSTKDGFQVVSVTNVPCVNVEFLIVRPEKERKTK